MFKVTYKPSTSHWIFPPIIMGILAILLVIMFLQHLVKCKKEGRPLFKVKGYRFFVENWDKVRLLGTLGLLIVYFPAMELMGFLPASILFVFLFNVLFSGIEQLASIPVAFKTRQFWSNPDFRSLLISLIISVVSSILIWFIFGQVFNITLP
ncbi:tripartite tricarboxylate transporter TctB family protein [uncultured Sphaerochaeta sp.]|uniref:tripartite tricarboxylate transporter TctB family protein n=1 Tax=uncultured Sphaerochaeta sp. TaxID=886478 RepID=UPI002A0A40FA|nr:tripartite tricarboxylate transporter TctB family protein [uncultured Sphaerochaeta sp.]